MMVQTKSYDRTKKSIKNSLIAVLLQVMSMLIGFWSRRIFLNHLGTEVLGLNTTATSLLQFLNLAELGIGGAIAVTLYKPIFDDDKLAIKEIVALQGWLYKIIALVVIIGSSILMCFFPMIFSKTPLPLWYAYASFGVLLYSSLLGYFFNYKQILLDAHQLNYKIQLSTKLISIFKLVIQAFAVKFIDNGYIWWLIIEVVFATVTAVILSNTVNKTFPFIREKISHPAKLRFKYPSVVTKVKQLFFHKIGGFVIEQTTPLIIYAFASLTIVAKYGNYLIFTSNLTALLGAIFMGLSASVGNMVASKDKALTLKVFRELFSSRFCMVSVCCICLWFLIEPFITLWIGPEYILDRSTLALIIVLFFIANIRGVVDIFINAHGLFWDIWSPLVEATICLTGSILLGKSYGLNGILGGLIISQIAVIMIWKPILLFKYGLKESIRQYVSIFLKHLVISIISFISLKLVVSGLPYSVPTTFAQFLIFAFCLFSICTLINLLLVAAFEKGMRGFLKRIISSI